MMGSLFTRLLLMAFGYAYPAYECFKAVEIDKPDIDQLLFWCHYWILVAVLTVCERVGDVCISWLPLYGEAKLAFFIYLWHPHTRGATRIYNTFLKRYVAEHEREFDGYLQDMKNRAILICQQASLHGQAKLLEILHYASSRTPPLSNSLSPPAVLLRKMDAAEIH